MVACDCKHCVLMFGPKYASNLHTMAKKNGTHDDVANIAKHVRADIHEEHLQIPSDAVGGGAMFGFGGIGRLVQGVKTVGKSMSLVVLVRLIVHYLPHFWHTLTSGEALRSLKRAAATVMKWSASFRSADHGLRGWSIDAIRAFTTKSYNQLLSVAPSWMSRDQVKSTLATIWMHLTAFMEKLLDGDAFLKWAQDRFNDGLDMLAEGSRSGNEAMKSLGNQMVQMYEGLLNGTVGKASFASTAGTAPGYDFANVLKNGWNPDMISPSLKAVSAYASLSLFVGPRVVAEMITLPVMLISKFMRRRKFSTAADAIHATATVLRVAVGFMFIAFFSGPYSASNMVLPLLAVAVFAFTELVRTRMIRLTVKSYNAIGVFAAAAAKAALAVGDTKGKGV